MKDSIIKGKAAYRYEERISKSKSSKAFDKFILQNVKPHKIICDLCCGSGNTITLLKNKAKKIVGVDASPDMIQICKKKYSNNPKINLLFGSAAKIRLESKYFDYIILRMGLHHIKDKELIMKEIYRILKDDGRLILIDKYYKEKWVYLLKGLFNLHKLLLNRFIKSKKYNSILLSKRFKILKKELIIGKKRKTTQTFMLVLKKK